MQDNEALVVEGCDIIVSKKIHSKIMTCQTNMTTILSPYLIQRSEKDIERVQSWKTKVMSIDLWTKKNQTLGRFFRKQLLPYPWLPLFSFNSLFLFKATSMK